MGLQLLLTNALGLDGIGDVTRLDVLLFRMYILLLFVACGKPIDDGLVTKSALCFLFVLYIVDILWLTFWELVIVALFIPQNPLLKMWAL